MSSDRSLEDLLRDRLQRDARLISLPERRPTRAAARARARRRNRRVGLTGGAVVLAGAAAVLPALRGSGSAKGDVATEGALLTPTGPLTLDWQRYDGGPGETRATFQDDQGVIYALSTAPGAATGESEDHRPALYRLGDDGAWQPLVLDEGAAPQAIDVSGTDGLLYAVSTGPGGDDPDVAQLSSSSDGGSTWTTHDLPPVAPPSDAIEWKQNQTLAVESHGSTTLALVTTTFEPADVDGMFPELAASDGSTILQVEARAEGFALVRYQGNQQDGGVMIDPAGGEVGEAGEVVRVVRWSDLGIDSYDAMTPPSELFRSGEDGWEPLGDAGGSFADLTVAGGRFVLIEAPTGAETGSTVRASRDGSSWSDVALPAPGRVVGVNDVLVDVPDDLVDGALHASSDGGLTWEPLDVDGLEISPESGVSAVSGGPLGLALVTSTPDGAPQLTVSGDLVDWTTTSLSEITGIDGPGNAAVFVGADRIVVRTNRYGGGDDGMPPPQTVTAVATPIRTH